MLEQTKAPIRLMLDSGAYTALHQGITIDLDAYCRFIEKNRSRLWCYVSLDDIESPEKSAENFQIMKARGLAPMPVFHAGEPLQWLKKMIDGGERYIGVSLSAFEDKLSKEAQAKQKRLLNEAFNILSRHQDIRVHAFGIMNPKLLQPYRKWWYSADSSSWVKVAKYGRIYAPYPTENGYDYRNEQISMNVDEFGKQSIRTEMVQKWLNDHGIGPAHLALTKVIELPEVRRQALLIYYQKLCQANEIESVFATLPQKDLSAQLNQMKANTRLLSYFRIKHWQEGELHYYVNYGKPPPSKEDRIRALIKRAEQAMLQKLDEPIIHGE